MEGMADGLRRRQGTRIQGRPNGRFGRKTGLREYQRRYDLYGEAAVINDHDMIADTVHYIFETSSSEDDSKTTTTSTATTKWEVIGAF
jgi:hypothetical protein